MKCAEAWTKVMNTVHLGQYNMPSIKIYPPTPLPDRKVDETQFNIWTEEIEVYLSQENDFALFLPGAIYDNWASFETNNLRIDALKQADRVIAGAILLLTKLLMKTLRDSPSDREIFALFSPSLGNVYLKDITTQSSVTPQAFRCDYDIQQKGIHFFNILDLKYDSQSTTSPFILVNIPTS